MLMLRRCGDAGGGGAWRGMHAMLYASLDAVSACLSASLPGCRLAVSLPLLRQGVPQDLARTASGSAELPCYILCYDWRSAYFTDGIVQAAEEGALVGAAVWSASGGPEGDAPL